MTPWMPNKVRHRLQRLSTVVVNRLISVGIFAYAATPSTATSFQSRLLVERVHAVALSEL